MLALIEGIKDHLEYPLVCLYILTILNIVQAVTDAIRIVDVCQQGRRQLVIGHIRFLTLGLLNELTPMFIQYDLSKIAPFIAAKLQEVVFENTTHHVQGRDSRLDVPELIPQRSIGVLDRIVVLVLGRNFLALTLAKLDGGDIIVLPNHVERRAVIITDLLISDFPMEVHVVRQYKQLLDVVARNLRIQVLGIVPADVDHLTDDRTDEEQGCAIHAGYRVINNDNLLFEFLAAHATTNLMVEVQECDEVTLTLTEVFGHGAILADNLIYIFYADLGTNAEALETRVPQDFIDTVNGSFRVCVMLVQDRNLCGKISDFLF